MKLPQDSPEWLAKVLEAIGSQAGEMLEKSQTADEALRAAGAFRLLKFAEGEFEAEAFRQEKEFQALTKKLNARNS